MRDSVKIILVSIASAIAGAVAQESIRTPPAPPTVKIVPASPGRKPCQSCNGLGHVWHPWRPWVAPWDRGRWSVCPACNGLGSVPVP